MVVQHFRFRKMRLYIGFPGSELSPSSFDKMPMQCLCRHKVDTNFVCGDYDKILMETGKLSDNMRVTDIGFVSGVDRVF